MFSEQSLRYQRGGHSVVPTPIPCLFRREQNACNYSLNRLNTYGILLVKQCNVHPDRVHHRQLAP